MVASDSAVVPFPGADPPDEAGRRASHPPRCPVCGRPATADHPVPPQVHSAPAAPRLPDGLASVLARTGQVSRRAREERAAEQGRIRELVGYLQEQVTLFSDAMQTAGSPPSVMVRVPSVRGRLARGNVATWAVRHWRGIAVVVGDVPRARHLYVGADGQLYESPDDPGESSAKDSAPVAERVDLAGLLLSMGEVDATHMVERVIHGLADLMKEAGATL